MYIYWLIFSDENTGKEVKKIGTLNRKDLKKLIIQYKSTRKVSIVRENLETALGKKT